MKISIRRSEPDELDLLKTIEQKAFPLYKQSNIRQLSHSLKSHFQQVWLADAVGKNPGNKTVGSVILYIYKYSIRIYSIAVLPEYQGKGVGKRLLTHVVNLARSRGFKAISLEAESDDHRLVQWYVRNGYKPVKELPDYYGKGKHAVKLQYPVSPEANHRTTNLIVVDNPARWKFQIQNAEVMSAIDLITDKDRVSLRKVRIFNLCNSYSYQSLGYYVSLLASARDQRVIPNVTTIKDFNDIHVIHSIVDDFDDLVQKSLSSIREKDFRMNVYFGNTENPHLRTLAKKLYQVFETPLFSVHFVFNHSWGINKMRPLTFGQIKKEDFKNIEAYANEYFKAKRFNNAKLKNYDYCLGILVNPEEKNPPSNRIALKKMKEIAEKNGFYTEMITREDYTRLTEFDALFIRETTGANDYTYQFSRKAYAEGLVVIDDPWSILRCSNKIYLNESLSHNKINTPKTVVLSKRGKMDVLLRDFKYPLVVKQPDSAFSLGVTKVHCLEELESTIQQLFKDSDLVLIQEFLPTEYDWRIGILDNQPLFACKYFMAKNHWQIINWDTKSKLHEGNSETVSIRDVPSVVLDTALQASSLIGDGLYGVDVKLIGDKAYVIEVNDNPNIDAGIEDKIDPDKLYSRMMQSFRTRIEMSRSIEHFVSVRPRLIK